MSAGRKMGHGHAFSKNFYKDVRTGVQNAQTKMSASVNSKISKKNVCID